jgi:hypothetical protein
MEKYAVEIDPKKVEQEKTAGKSPPNNPSSNIPLDPEKGSEPFEKESGKKAPQTT